MFINIWKVRYEGVLSEVLAEAKRTVVVHVQCITVASVRCECAPSAFCCV